MDNDDSTDGEEQPLTDDGECALGTAALREPATPSRRHLQDLLDLRGIGAHLANGEDPDEYVRRLREGWG
jgi:hypothetical protein